METTMRAMLMGLLVMDLLVMGLCECRAESPAGGIASVKKNLTPAQLAVGDPIENSIGMVLVPIPAGEFTMGSPKSEIGRVGNETRHRVKLVKSFYLGHTEVTQQQYETVMGRNPSRFTDPDHPVERVSWDDAVEFCRRLSQMAAEQAAGNVYYLPTEAEWEYACRAGTTSVYSFGNDAQELGEHAWFAENSNRTTQPVGRKKPNAWVLYDMHGNVREWCQDWYGEYPSDNNGSREFVGPSSGSYRVNRGGSWYFNAGDLRSALRAGTQPTSRNNFLGFRVLRRSAEQHAADKPRIMNVATVKQNLTPAQLSVGDPIVNSVGMVLAPIPSGRFLMGSSDLEVSRGGNRAIPQHAVLITKPFYLGVTEVTQEQYQKVMGERLARKTSRFFSLRNGPNNPVGDVSWDNAVEFCRRLNELTAEQAAGNVYRLPTEAEWEYACRAGTTTAYSFGDDRSRLGEYAWHETPNGRSRTAGYPVGQKKPNPWGLFGMHGNKSEWCQDWQGDYPDEAVTDPTGPASGTFRVIRGGNVSSFRRSDKDVSYRSAYRHSGWFSGVGFRVLRTTVDQQVPVNVFPEPTAESLTADEKPTPATVPDVSTVKKNLTPAQLAIDDPLVNSIGMVLVPIPGGEFMMGSNVPATELLKRFGIDPKYLRRGGRPQPLLDEYPRHYVRITKSFYLGATEVTQVQYERVIGKNPSRPSFGFGPHKPVNELSWGDAVEFCGRLSALPEERAAGRVYRLPTEAEWEYSCRGGTTTMYQTGDDPEELVSVGNVQDASVKPIHKRTGTSLKRRYLQASDAYAFLAPVGRFRANGFGLYDMHGNVSEWCRDVYGPYPPGPVIDPTGLPGSRRISHHVYRGSSYRSDAVNSRSSRRVKSLRTDKTATLGFRVLYSPVDQPTAANAPRRQVEQRATRTDNLLPVKIPDADRLKKTLTPAQLAVGDPIVNSVDMVLIPIPAGKFRMGSPDSDTQALDVEKPQHLVQISTPYYLGMTEVTQAQYQRVMDKNPSLFQGADNPVENVSWNSAVEFCRRLSQRPEEQAAGNVYRLPTEAEWEYACRIGMTTGYVFGEDRKPLAKYAWFGDNSNQRTHRVGQKMPNPWGLYDMHGNVFEWCHDCYIDFSPGAVTDPTGPIVATGSLSNRVLRGGSWQYPAWFSRSVYRGSGTPVGRNSDLGFRVLRSSAK